MNQTPKRATEIEALPGRWTAEALTSCLVGFPEAVALESSLDVGGMGRWHIFGAEAIGGFRSYGLSWEASLAGERRVGRGDPWAAVEGWWERWRDSEDLRRELPLTSGAIGYWGFELADAIEVLPPSPGAERFSSLPDLHLQLYDELVIVEAATGRAWATHRGRPGRNERRWWEREPGSEVRREAPLVERERSISDEAYLRAIEEIRSAIGRGDVYEVNLTRTHRFEGGPTAWELHRRLRRHQPVPYAACLPWSPVSVISASPERFLWRRGAMVETRPIKGTAARTGDPEVDARAGRALLASEKERAELAMIIDLERNDLGRVCLPGTVRVIEEAALEPYATVQHTVATVRGELPTDLSPFELLRATFPGGSITGAPKISAIETIRSLEPWPRKVYTGSIGWLDPAGNLDLSIAIRTVMQTETDSYLSLGGAITWDSDPAAELRELHHKGRAIERALGRAPEGADPAP